MGRIYRHFFLHESSTGIRILSIVLLAILALVAVRMIRRVSEWLAGTRALPGETRNYVAIITGWTWVAGGWPPCVFLMMGVAGMAVVMAFASSRALGSRPSALG